MPKKKSKKTVKSPKKVRKNNGLLSKPDVVGSLGFAAQFVVSIVCYYKAVMILPYPKVMWGIGFGLMILGFIVSYLYQREHGKVGNEVLGRIRADEVEKLIVVGIYGKIRHPGYLGAILMQFGMAFASQSFIPIVFAVFLLILWVVILVNEEYYLSAKFGKQYKDYIDEVKWRLIPLIF